MIIGHEFLYSGNFNFYKLYENRYLQISLNLHDLLSLNLDITVVPSITNTNFRGFRYVYPQN